MIRSLLGYPRRFVDENVWLILFMISRPILLISNLKAVHSSICAGPKWPVPCKQDVSFLSYAFAVRQLPLTRTPTIRLAVLTVVMWTIGNLARPRQLSLTPLHSQRDYARCSFAGRRRVMRQRCIDLLSVHSFPRARNAFGLSIRSFHLGDSSSHVSLAQGIETIISHRVILSVTLLYVRYVNSQSPS